MPPTASQIVNLILGQVVHGVYDDEIRQKVLEKGGTLTLNQAIDILRVAEPASKKTLNLNTGYAAAIKALSKSSYKEKENAKTSQHTILTAGKVQTAR